MVPRSCFSLCFHEGRWERGNRGCMSGSWQYASLDFDTWDLVTNVEGLLWHSRPKNCGHITADGDTYTESVGPFIHKN